MVDHAVRMTHSLRSTPRSLYARGVAVNREIPLSAIDDGEHLLHRVVEVLGWAAAGLRLATQNEVNVHVHFPGIDKWRAPVQAGGAMGVAPFRLRQIGVSDPIG
jgi:hypothetical protein